MHSAPPPPCKQCFYWLLESGQICPRAVRKMQPNIAVEIRVEETLQKIFFLTLSRTTIKFVLFFQIIMVLTLAIP